MKQVELQGKEALQAISDYFILTVLNGQFRKNIDAITKEVMESSEEDIMTKTGMSKEKYMTIAILMEIQNLSDSLHNDFKKLTGLNGEAFKIKTTTTPTIVVEEVNINNKEEK